MTHLTEPLTFSFWIWALQDLPPGGCYHDFDRRMLELKARGGNCIVCESGAGLAFDPSGRPRGPVNVCEPFPGLSRKLRQQFAVGEPGPCDYRRRLLELFSAAKRHQLKIALTSFYFLHTYWYTEESLNDELFAIEPHRRYQEFARFLDRILVELEENDLISQLAFAEIFNEADGLAFSHAKRCREAEQLRFRDEHENALAFLKERHPECHFAYSTGSPFTNVNLIPRNAEIWNCHPYYLWPVYEPLERGFVSSNPGPQWPDERWLDGKLTLNDVHQVRFNRRSINEDWYRREWLYSSLRPDRIAELDAMLAENLQKNEEFFKKRADEAFDKAAQIHAEILPDADLVMTEGATYCGSELLRWEENSDVYWRIIEYAARRAAAIGTIGFNARTNSGCDESSWEITEARIRRVNQVFLEAVTAAGQLLV